MKTEVINNQRVRIYDNGGESFDRYTAVYLDAPENTPGLFFALAMSENPFDPQGFGQHCTAMDGRHLGKRIAFADLPADCRKAVLQDLQMEVA